MIEKPDSSNEDRLINLPPSIVDIILVLLPIKDAVRTSILSRKWRYRWTSILQLVFNEECIPRRPRGYYNCSEDNSLNLLRRVSIVDQVLLCHKGPIHKFQCMQCLQSCPDIHRWITFLSSHPIKEFTLQCLKGDHYKVPSNLFSYQDLQYLLLTNCIVQPPRTYSGFTDLTTLKLFSVSISSVALESLLSTCKSLQELGLIDFQGLTHLKILGPNLKRIYISGSFQGLHLDAPHLTSAGIDLCNKIGDEQEPMREGHGCNLVEALGCLPHVERLVVENYFLKAYSEKRRGIEEFAWEAYDCQLNCLRSMVMLGITDIENELSLLGFVVANAPVLRTMTIQFAKNVRVEELKNFKKLIRFRIASTQATIEYLEDSTQAAIDFLDDELAMDEVIVW